MSPRYTKHHPDFTKLCRKLLLAWHLDAQERYGTEYRDPCDHPYADLRAWIQEVMGDKYGIGTTSLRIEVLTQDLITVGGSIHKREGATPAFPRIKIYPGSLERWPVDWPILDNEKFPEQSAELMWRELCREGFLL